MNEISFGWELKICCSSPDTNKTSRNTKPTHLIYEVCWLNDSIFCFVFTAIWKTMHWGSLLRYSLHLFEKNCKIVYFLAFDICNILVLKSHIRPRIMRGHQKLYHQPLQSLFSTDLVILYLLSGDDKLFSVFQKFRLWVLNNI